MTQSETINCLRCRGCTLLPQTDFNSATPFVLCARMGVRVACLTSCPIANPNKRYHGTSDKSVRLNGDKTHNVSPVELAYLRVHYPATPFEQLARVTQRSIATLKAMGHRYQLGRARIDKNKRQEIVRAAVGCRQRKGMIFTPEQHAYIRECCDSGHWVYRGGARRPETVARNDAIKADIVAQVARLGPAWTWTQIVKHVQYTSPWYGRLQAVKRARRRQQRKEVAHG